MLTTNYLSYAGLLKQQPLTTLREAALAKVRQNLVSLAEVDRVIPEE